MMKKIFEELVRAAALKYLRKQGLADLMPYGYIEYGQPYRFVTASHPMGVGGLSSEGQFAVPGKIKGYNESYDGKLAIEDWRIIYGKEILKREYNIDDEIKSIVQQFKNKVKKMAQRNK